MTELYAAAYVGLANHSDFCLIPMGTPTTSVGAYVAECQRVLASMADDGIRFELHGYGTNVEGPISSVWRALQRCHEAVHAMGVERIATDIRLGTRTGKRTESPAWSQGLSENERKRESVRRRLAGLGEYLVMWRPLYQRGVRFSSSYAPCTKYMRATHLEPSVKLDDAVHRYRETTLGTYVRPPIVFSHGRGLDLFATVPGEAQSRRYLDFTGGIAVNALGHADPQVAAIAAEQAAQLVHCSNLYYNTWSGELAHRLASMTREHGGLGLAPQSPPAASGQDLRAFIANSGTEANEAALKFARKAAKGTALVCFQHAFHGRTMGALSVTPNAKYQAPFLPLVGDVRVGALNDMAQLESLVTEDVAGVIVEPIQGEGGILPAQVEWLTALRQRCTAVGAALIYDEIQCGLFRTGHMWCHSAMPVEAHPDMVTMAKPLANGFPIGAVLMRPHIAHAIAAGDHGTTFGGGPLTCRIAHHVLGRLGEPRLREHIDSASTHLFERLERISEAFSDMVSAPRGRGLIAGISMRSAPWAGEVVRLARERGVLFLTAGSDVVRFVPSLTVERAHIDEAMDVLESVLLVLRST